MKIIYGLKLSQPCCWIFKSCGIWWPVYLWLVTRRYNTLSAL